MFFVPTIPILFPQSKIYGPLLLLLLVLLFSLMTLSSLLLCSHWCFVLIILLLCFLWRDVSVLLFSFSTKNLMFFYFVIQLCLFVYVLAYIFRIF